MELVEGAEESILPKVAAAEATGVGEGFRSIVNQKISYATNKKAKI
jgi:hypothetical protein